MSKHTQEDLDRLIEIYTNRIDPSGELKRLGGLVQQLEEKNKELVAKAEKAVANIPALPPTSKVVARLNEDLVKAKQENRQLQKRIDVLTKSKVKAENERDEAKEALRKLQRNSKPVAAEPRPRSTRIRRSKRL